MFGVQRSNAFKQIVVNLTWTGTAVYGTDYTVTTSAARRCRRTGSS